MCFQESNGQQKAESCRDTVQSVILGTAASEGIPAAFCDCDVCRRARVLGGKNIRTRSDFLIDEKNIIDFGPDIFSQCLREGIDLCALENIFLTHFHDDHFALTELITRNSGASTGGRPLNIYCSAEALDGIKELFTVYKDHTHADAPDYFTNFRFISLEPFKKYNIGGLSVTPVLSNHYGYGKNELGFNYIIKKQDGKCFLYTADTGWYGERTWEFLEADKPVFNCVVSECTYGTFDIPIEGSGHFNFKNLLVFIEKLARLGCISRETPIYITHICHLSLLSHEETMKYFETLSRNFVMGYDGMRIL